MTQPHKDAQPSDLVLRWTLLLGLGGFLFSFIVLGHIASTLRAMYGLALLSFAGYAIARGPKDTASSFVEYISSWTLAPRWGFILFAALSLLWTVRTDTSSPASGVSRVFTLVLIQLSGWVVYDGVRKLGELDNILRVIFYSAAAGAIIALLDFSRVDAYRIRGIFGNPNVLAITGSLGLLAFFTHLTAVARLWEKLLDIPLVIALHTAVFASGSRKGILGLVFVWGVGLLLRHSRKVTTVVILVVLAAGFTGFVVAPSSIKFATIRSLQRLGTTFVQSQTTATIDFSTAERARFVEEGLSLMAESPFFGHGMDTFRVLSGEGTYAHNNYVDLGVGVGLLGVLLFYAFPLTLLYRLIKLRCSFSPRDASGTAFGISSLILILILDMGAVTYMAKLVSIIPILLAGVVDDNRQFGLRHRRVW